MANSSFVERVLRATITLGIGTFGSTNSNVVQFQDLRIVADIDKAGGMALGTARIRVYGLSQSIMNQLTTLSWKVLTFTRNTIDLEAGDGDVMTLVFSGQILNAWADYSAQPDVYLLIEAQTGGFDQVVPVSPLSYRGSTSAAIVAQQLAQQMGVAFENNGVAVQLANPYFPGSAIEQLRALSKAAGFNFFLDDKTLAICPKGTPRSGQIPEIGPTSGLRGYPTFDRMGINLSTLFNPGVVFGSQIKVVTSVTPAQGVWQVYSMAHHLESIRPGGPWFTDIHATEPGNVAIS